MEIEGTGHLSGLGPLFYDGFFKQSIDKLISKWEERKQRNTHSLTVPQGLRESASAAEKIPQTHKYNVEFPFIFMGSSQVFLRKQQSCCTAWVSLRKKERGPSIPSHFLFSEQSHLLKAPTYHTFHIRVALPYRSSHEPEIHNMGKKWSPRAHRCNMVGLR